MQYDTSPWPVQDVWFSSPWCLPGNADMLVLDCVHYDHWFGDGSCFSGVVSLVGSFHVLLGEGISES